MDQPMIPPGCEQWERWFVLAILTDDRGCVKQLRADHYRCAWLDEVQRLHDSMRLKEFPGDSEDLQAAWQHAEAWRVWGAGK